jgi:nitrile hydratase
VNSIHDMGGMDGFGPIMREANEPVFHAEWERRMFGLSFGIANALSLSDDHFRQEIERIPPAAYLRASYYELWYRSYSALLQQRGVPSYSHRDAALQPEQALSMIECGGSTRMPSEGIVARFLVGDAVIARNINPTGHTRLPRYVRGRSGMIHANRGVFSFADSNARGDGPCPQYLYSVAFAGEELWGESARKETIYLDLWDGYLDPAPR